MTLDFEPTPNHHQKKWIKLDTWLTSHIEGKLCSEADCVCRAEVGVRFLVDGREVELGLCAQHVAELDRVAATFPWQIGIRRTLEEGEGVGGPDGT